MKSRKKDFLYHLGLEWIENSSNTRIRDFSDVCFIILGGKPSRMEVVAKSLEAKMEPDQVPLGVQEVAEVTKAGRYVMYKVGPVLTVSHGMGRPSLSILLEELAKLLYYAKMHREDLLAQPISFLRLGTCGSLGVEPGNLILTTEALMPNLSTGLIKYALDKKVVYSSEFSPELIQKITKYCNNNKQLPQVFEGKTITTDDFYLGQGRFDGYFQSDFNREDRQAFFEKAYKQGVRNFEMEASELAAFCNRPGSPLTLFAATLCVSLLDRIKGDQVNSSQSDIKAWEKELVDFASLFVCHALKVS